MARKRRPLVWGEKQSTALDHVFEGRLSYEKIALLCTVPLRTLKDWIAHPDFKTALAEKRAHMVESLDHKPYIRKERRLAALADMAEKAREQYEARPLLVEIRPTRDGQITNESHNDGAFGAFRGALDDIAKELGERSSNVKVSGSLQHQIMPADADVAVLKALRQQFGDRPELLDEIASAMAAGESGA